MIDVSVAVSDTLPALCTLLESMCAFAFVRITFTAAAPAPLIPIAPSPNDADAEAAAVQALIVALPVALREIAPVVVFTSVSPLAMYASTAVEISLSAMAAAIEIVPATTPAAAASDAAPVIARIVDVSVAESEMLAALMPPSASSPSPSMYAADQHEDAVLGGGAGPAQPDADDPRGQRGGRGEHDRLDRLARGRRQRESRRWPTMLERSV